MRITYSTDLLRQMWSPDKRPSRMLRKTLFNARIWCPANGRSQRCLPAALSRGASSSSTHPDDFLDRSPPPPSSPHPPPSPRPAVLNLWVAPPAGVALGFSRGRLEPHEFVKK